MELQENAVCPGCQQSSHVRRKLLTSPFFFEQPEAETGAETGHISITTHSNTNSNGPGATGFFVNGYFCDTCSIGFVTHELLQEAGSDVDHRLRSRVFTSWRSARLFEG